MGDFIPTEVRKTEKKIQFFPDKAFHDIYEIDGRLACIGIEVCELSFPYAAPKQSLQDFKNAMIKKDYDWDELGTVRDSLTIKGMKPTIFLYLETITDHLAPYCGLEVGDDVRESMRLMMIEVRETGVFLRGDVKKKIETIFGTPFNTKNPRQMVYLAIMGVNELFEMEYEAKKERMEAIQAVSDLRIRTTNLETEQERITSFVDDEVPNIVQKLKELDKTVKEELKFISEDDLGLIHKIVRRKAIPLALKQFPERSKNQLFPSIHGLILDSVGLHRGLSAGRRKLEKIPRDKTDLAIRVAWGIYCLLKKRLDHPQIIRELDFREGKFVEYHPTLMNLVIEYGCWEDVEEIIRLCSKHGRGLSNFLKK